MRTINLENIPLGIMSTTIILAASIVLVISITEFENVNIVYGQGDNSTSSLTPQQKTAICDPNDKSVNTTESKICGIPVTVTPHSSNMTTGAQVQPSQTFTALPSPPSG
ncbi:MAG TPA: hypothetical protein VJ729_07375 [Nitrososphaeraceae archaeon]|jgi:hypothetical protein|nr:hypothetical protein [Nitrososphaeraceae archaeon]